MRCQNKAVSRRFVVAFPKGDISRSSSHNRFDCCIYTHSSDSPNHRTTSIRELLISRLLHSSEKYPKVKQAYTTSIALRICHTQVSATRSCAQNSPLPLKVITCAALVLVCKLTLFSAMFSTSIFIVEADLHDKPATHSSSSNNNSTNSGIRIEINIKTLTPAHTTKNNKAPVKTNYYHCFLFNPIPKPVPVLEPPTSETVDDALGPKPEPIPGLSTPAPISWKVLWASWSAPTNPTI